MTYKFGFKNTVAMVLALSCGIGCSVAESIDQLADRVGMKRYYSAIRVGDRNGFDKLPAKGYSNGLTGILLHYNLYPNPEYSFADCRDDAVFVKTSRGVEGKPGCRVSLKLATKEANGEYRDRGVRMEYAIGLGQKQFSSNNSVYAEYAITGSRLLAIALPPP